MTRVGHVSPIPGGAFRAQRFGAPHVRVHFRFLASVDKFLHSLAHREHAPLPRPASSLSSLLPLVVMLVAETAVASQDGLHETVTLWAETATPRRRPVSESYKRVRTPLGELPPARRRRKKTESMVRSRAVLKLHPIEHDRHLEADRARKKEAARREQAAREARERDAAELAEQAARKAAQLERETAQKAAELEREAAQRSAQKAEAQRRFNYLWRFLRKQRCGSCTTCAPGGRLRSRASAPCETGC